MLTELNHLVASLQKRLSNSLPGQEAHQLAKVQSQTPFSLEVL